MIQHHLKHKPLSRTGKMLFVLCMLGGSLATSVFTDRLQGVLAAESTEINNNVAVDEKQALSQSVYEKIEAVIKRIEEDKYQEAEAVLDELSDMNAADSLTAKEQQVMWQFYGDLARMQDNYAGAITYDQKILDLDGINADVREKTLFQLGSMYYATEDYAKAIEVFIQLLEITKEPNVDATLRIAYAYYQLAQYDSALLYTERAIEQGKKDKSTYNLLRALYLTNEKYIEAEAVVETMVELFDDEEDKKLLEQIKKHNSGDRVNASEALDSSLPVAEVAKRAEYLPIVVIQPKYPKLALQKGIEGWNHVQFTVDEKGNVVDPVIIDSNPEQVFDKASLNAIAQFKFNPRIKDGVAVATEGVQYVFRYNLSM